MGSRGIRRRKPVHHLPKVSSRDLPTENDLIPPHIMWPAKGSGFDPSAFSPAGSAQRGWRLTQGLARNRRTRWLVWAAIAWTVGGVCVFAVNVIRMAAR